MEATVFALKKRTVDPANSMHTGTNASRAICNVAFIALPSQREGAQPPLMGASFPNIDHVFHKIKFAHRDGQRLAAAIG
jgi:hypothetical protein